MIPTSDDYRAALAADNRNFYCEAVITLYDETTLTVTNEHIWANGFRIKQAVSGKSSLEVGACIINELTLVLNNIDGDFDGLLFDGAKVVAKIGLYDADGQLIDIDGEGGTTIQKGEYYVDEVTGDETLITLTCLDAMANLDRDFAELAVVYPATLQSIVSAIASACSVRFTQLSFHNNSYTVTQAPDDAALTCRDALSMIAQIAGSYATIDRTGELTLAWFDTDFLKSAILDGGTYWHDIDDADGGSFWSGGDTYDGGGLYLSDFELTSGFYRFSRSITDLRITGVAVSDGETNHLAGDEGYTFQLRDNAFINPGDEATIASDLGARLIGMTFRPFEADHLPDPTLEPGDTIAITDRFGQRYLSMVTETEFSAWSRQKTACNAETPSRNASRRYLASEKAAAVEVKSYDKTVNAYVDFISNAYGMYRSQITDPDDATSQIYAFHDQSTMANSLFCVYEGAAGIKVGRRDSVNDPWVYSPADATDAVCLVRLLTANTAIINQLFAQDISVSGALHSTDYVPALPGASPPYSQAGMGLDFGDKEFEGENFAIDANGKLYANGAEFIGAEITGGRITLTDAGGSNPNLRVYKETDPDNYGTVIGSVTWLKEWYDPNDAAHFYYYAWRFNNGEMTGGVADDVMRMRLNWQKGTIEAVGDVSAWSDLTVGNNLDVGGALTLGTPLSIANGGTGATDRLTAFKNLTNQNVGANATYFVTLTQNWATAGYSNNAQVKTALGMKCTQLYSGTFKSGSTTFSLDYEFFIIYGSSGGGARESVVVPKACLGTSDTTVLISDDECYLTVKLKYSGSTVTMTFGENKKTGGTTMTAGFINRVYGVLAS